ncbi:MAG: YggS family pyridoxal phosphate-dependent enzyme [Planctomycetota bacterium]
MKELLQKNLTIVRERVADACLKSGRTLSDISIVAVTKYLNVAQIASLLEVGLYDLGENRVQELVRKSEALSPEIRWHMIGHLQRNKARKACEKSVLIHSIDSERLLEAVSAAGESLGRTIDVLIEINVSGEDTKQGASPSDLKALVERAMQLTHVNPIGLMTMAPIVSDPEDARPYFSALRELASTIRESFSLDGFRELSMGMSGDYEAAVKEGATILRIGSALYEGIL